MACHESTALINHTKESTLSTVTKPPTKPCWCGDDCSCCVIPCVIM
ncbi:Protein of unknown function [Pyronema omphalodes CBS 100304]|uniref:Uncharacterized protein n=1 Tax=Pyronema omphalodes (strain CBS 100304) TaxID=1076935 RepID=U4L3D8_PYROM|nr:Protein of unknown function [Pyronema omphalodes CBS 100304]